MGLDAVELVMRTEDEFGITLADDEAGSVKTVGDLYQLVLSKLDLTPSCLSSKAFYRTRQALVACLRVPRRSIRPSSDLESILPEPSRRQSWSEIAEHIKLEFPRLQYPARWRQRFFRFGALISATVVLTCSTLVLRTYPGFVSGLALWIPAFAIWMILFAAINSALNKAATSLRTGLPCETAGDLSQLVLTLNYEFFSPTATLNTATSKEYVWKKLVEIICDQLQIEPEEVVPNASFVDDLGVD
jgi:acyl carrier protein